MQIVIFEKSMYSHNNITVLSRLVYPLDLDRNMIIIEVQL